MASNDPQSEEPGDGRDRVPLERKISLKFKEFRGFITEYSANISPGGMFIITDTPQEPGSVFDFEFRLAEDDFQIIHGLGEVAWVREEAQGSARPGGMGIRFLHLDDGSRELIERMVEEHVRSGGTPFDLDQDAPRGDELDVGSPTVGEAPESVSDPPESPGPDAGYGLPADTRDSESREAVGQPSAEEEIPTPPGASEAEESVPGEEPGSFERFDAALASLKTGRDTGEELPPGFDEVSAALRDEDVEKEPAEAEELPEGVVRPPSPATGREESSRLPGESPGRTSEEESFEEVPRPHVPAGSEASGRGRTGRWLLLVVLVVLAGAAAAHFSLPGGLPGLLPAAGSEPAPAKRSPPTPAETQAPVEEATPRPEPSAKEAETTASPAPAEPAAEPAPPPPERPFETLEEIDWSREEGRTVIELVTDGLVEEGRYRSFTLGGGNPRILVRLQDVARPYSPSTVTVGSDQVHQIRLGYHREPLGNELHVVFDLADPGVELVALEPDGGRLRAVFR